MRKKELKKIISEAESIADSIKLSLSHRDAVIFLSGFLQVGS
jgi:hypothetical protein